MTSISSYNLWAKNQPNPINQLDQRTVSNEHNQDILDQEAKQVSSQSDKDSVNVLQQVNKIIDALMSGASLIDCINDFIALGACNFQIDTSNPPQTILKFECLKPIEIFSNDPRVAQEAQDIVDKANDYQTIATGTTLDQMLGAQQAHTLEAKYSETLDADLVFGNFDKYIKTDCQDQKILNLFSNIFPQNSQTATALDNIFIAFQNEISKAQPPKGDWTVNGGQTIDDYMKDIEQLLYQQGLIKPGDPDQETIKDYIMSFMARNIVKTVMDQNPNDSLENLEQYFNKIGAGNTLDRAFVTMEGMITTNSNLPLQYQMDETNLHDFITNYKDAIRQNLKDNDVCNRDPKVYDDAIINAGYSYQNGTFKLILQVWLPTVDKNGNYITDKNGQIVYERFEN